MYRVIGCTTCIRLSSLKTYGLCRVRRLTDFKNAKGNGHVRKEQSCALCTRISEIKCLQLTRINENPAKTWYRQIHVVKFST